MFNKTVGDALSHWLSAGEVPKALGLKHRLAKHRESAGEGLLWPLFPFSIYFFMVELVLASGLML